MGKKVAVTASGISAYNVKEKESQEMTDVVIDKKEANGRTSYYAKGKFSSTGTNGCTVMGKDKAEAAIKENRATEGEGW